MSQQDQADTKIGSGHARGMLKQGLSELRAAFYPGSNIAQPPEYGIFGKETPGEVSSSREALGPDEEPSVLGEREQAAEAKRDEQAKSEHDKSDKGREQERD